jgi:hypothetical protein
MKVEIECYQCGKTFLRSKKEVNRSKRINRRQFCSRECVGKTTIYENIPQEFIGNMKHLRGGGEGRTKDEYSSFRPYAKTCRTRRHKHEVDISVEYLKEVWENQQGICPFTGWGLELRYYQKKKKKSPLTPKHASLDRIDTTKGYVKGNVRFISVMANYARNNFSDEQLICFCKSVSDCR